MIIIKANNVNAYCEGPDEELAQVAHALGYVAKGSRYWNAKRKEIRVSLYSSKYQMFPTGLIPYLLNTTHKWQDPVTGEQKGYRIEAEVVPNSSLPPYKAQSIALWDKKNDAPLVLRESQQKGIDAFLETHRGIIKLPPGIGKTILGIALTQYLNVNTLFVVHTKDLLQKTIQNFKDTMGIDVGVIGDDRWEPDWITVAIIKTLARRIDEDYVQEFLKSIQFCIFDEVQHASKDYQKVSRKLTNAYYRLGLSATPQMGDKGSKLQEMALCGPIIYQEKLHKLVKDGILAKPTAIFLDISEEGRVVCDADAVSENSIFRGPWNRQAIYHIGEVVYHYNSYYSSKKEIPASHTSLFEPGTPNGYDVWETDWQSVLQGGTIDNIGRNLILSHAISELVAEKLSTLVLIEKIKHGANLTAQVMELMGPETLISFVSGEDTTEDREEALKALEERRIDVLIASRIFNEGVDLKSLDAVVVASGFRAAGLTIQRFGRGLRTTETKKHMLYIDTLDKFHPILEKHSQARIDLCRKSKAFDIEICKWDDFRDVLRGVLEKRK